MLETVDYCPTLYARVAEVKAYDQLPRATKDAILPVFRWRPWPNARELSKTWGRLGEAIGGRRFILELDRSKYTSSPNKASDEEFVRLFDPRSGYENFYRFAEELPFSIPTLRSLSGRLVDLDAQAAHVDKIGRGVVWHVEHPHVVERELIDEVAHLFPDLVVLIDVGWGRDLLGREAWASRIIRLIGEVRPECEIILSGSSFPETFTGIGARAELQNSERPLFSNVIRNTNMTTLTYGDWGSTRPVLTPVPMRLIRRIDVAYVNQWNVFRQVDENDTYVELARRATNDPSWPSELKIWGTYAIEATAEATPGSIGSPAAAAAARINMHLYRQAQFGAPTDLGEADEPYVD